MLQSPLRKAIFRAVLMTALVLSLPGCASTIREEDVVGRYEICLMACKIIEIHPDHTFRYVAMTDIGSPPEVEGTWELLDNGLLEAESTDQPTGFPHEESFDPHAEDVVVRALLEDAPLPFGKVFVDYVDGHSVGMDTDQKEELHFPGGRVQKIRIEPGVVFGGFMGSYNGAEYEITDPGSNTFEVRFRWVPFYIRELWLVDHGKLYPVEHFPMKKVR